MFSDSTEIIEAGICGVKCRPPALTSAPVVTYRVRFSLPLLSKRIKTLTRNCDLLWSSMKKKGRKREGEKTTTRLGHVQEAERVCSPCVCASGRDRNSLKMVEIKADRHWDFHRYLHRGKKTSSSLLFRCVALRCVALRCAALRCVALPCVVLRCAVLCCVMECCVLLCCVVLCSIV